MAGRLKKGTKVIIAPESPFMEMDRSFDGGIGTIDEYLEVELRQFYGEYVRINLSTKIDGFKKVVVPASSIRRIR